MRIAIITAMAEETLPILKKLGNVVAQDTLSGVLVRQIELEGNTIYLATSGIGEIRAALTVQLLRDLFDIDVVLNFGFVGALNNALDIAELVIAERVCHYQFDLSAIDGTLVGQYDNRDDRYFYLDQTLIDRVLSAIGISMKKVTVASGDKFIADKNDKTVLKNEFNCDICDMEISGLALACERNNIPLLSIKVVSDKADESASASFLDVVKKGLSRYEQILPTILKAISGTIKPLPPIKKQR